MRSFGNVVLLSKTAPESIRAWGRERAVPASGQTIAGPTAHKARRAVLL